MEEGDYPVHLAQDIKGLYRSETSYSAGGNPAKRKKEHI
jgi:hypothetical protein